MIQEQHNRNMLQYDAVQHYNINYHLTTDLMNEQLRVKAGY